MKSQQSDLLQLAHCIYEDACARSTALSPDLRDLDTLRSRVRHEGMSFLTILLPNFARDVERSLELGRIDPSFFKNFKKNGAIPCFLQGMLGLVFDRGTGRIIDGDPFSSISIPDILISIRQTCLAFKKVEVECTFERTKQALEGFVTTEQSFSDFALSREDRDYFNLVSSVLWDNVFSRLRLDDIVPRHGPGATADGVTGNGKFHWRSWYERLEPYFPIVGFGYSISETCERALEDVTFVPEHEELPVRVTCVPKTLKGPRIIAIEPCCMQYAQQGLRGIITDAIESHWMTAGHINFCDQSINQSLAMSASAWGQLATIDLSDASDRVPAELVWDMLKGNVVIRDAVWACRSRYAKMPDGRVIGPLAKFASMGSALCFPMEAMYFFTLCVGSLLKAKCLPVTRRNCFLVSRSVYVYGDDILVPTDHAVSVLEDLQKYNCKVNVNKTFFIGRFRESCGVDAYEGVNVKPIYVHQLAPRGRQQAKEIISWIETARLFEMNGFTRSSEHMFKTCERVLGSLPSIPIDSTGLGRVSYFGIPLSSRNRWNADLQAREIRAWCQRPVQRTDVLDDHGALMKFFLNGSEESDPFGFRDKDELHLEQTALHGAVTLQRRWVTPHGGLTV